MGRFYEADQSVTDLIQSLIYDDERFPNLKAATIIAVMDSKPKVDKLTGRVTFAYIKTANEVEKFLTRDGHNIEGVDYIMFVNDLVWELANDKDKKRIISHELRHTFLDEKGNFKLVKHDIEDFYAEVRLNEDDPMWGQSLGTVAIAKIEQMKEEAKANR
jgi:hypothetical protein